MSSLQFKPAFSLVLLTSVGLGALVVLSLAVTNPSRIGPIGVTLWFIGLLLAMAGILAMVLYVFKSFLRPEDTKLNRLSNSWRQGLLIGGGAVVCLALQSLRQLGLRDLILVVILTGLIEFYFRTRR